MIPATRNVLMLASLQEQAPPQHPAPRAQPPALTRLNAREHGREPGSLTYIPAPRIIN